jgi:hypothetical protein
MKYIRIRKNIHLTTGIILRKIIELEQQGAELFFGEMSFDIDDLMRIDADGKGCGHV